MMNIVSDWHIWYLHWLLAGMHLIRDLVKYCIGLHHETVNQEVEKWKSMLFSGILVNWLILNMLMTPVC